MKLQCAISLLSSIRFVTNGKLISFIFPVGPLPLLGSLFLYQPLQSVTYSKGEIPLVRTLLFAVSLFVTTKCCSDVLMVWFILPLPVVQQSTKSSITSLDETLFPFLYTGGHRFYGFSDTYSQAL